MSLRGRFVHLSNLAALRGDQFHRVQGQGPICGQTLLKDARQGSQRLRGRMRETHIRETKMMRAFKLYTGPDNASHVLEGTIDEKDRTDVVAIHFKETPAHSSYDWHPDPEPQFVITLSGTLEFATPDGETFVVRPGDVLLAEDHIGKGHKWRLIDDQPWRRAYVVLKPGAKDSFVPKSRK
jgi:quercetin dioxygenase-like cupin family protein